MLRRILSQYSPLNAEWRVDWLQVKLTYKWEAVKGFHFVDWLNNNQGAINKHIIMSPACIVPQRQN